MLTYKQQITADCGDIILPKKTMFFDIETTGFSPDTTHLYMIGCCLYEDDGWQLIQWFDDTQTFEGEAPSYPPSYPRQKKLNTVSLLTVKLSTSLT